VEKMHSDYHMGNYNYIFGLAREREADFTLTLSDRIMFIIGRD
jgi:hypothetical protein